MKMWSGTFINRLILLASVAILTSCSYLKKDKNARMEVAKVGEAVLYEDEIADIFDEGIAPEDSIELRKNYIDKWVKDEMLFQHALRNLTDSLKNKEAQLQEYYRSLIRYEYEKQLIRQRLDTNITRKEIEDYYERYNDGFALERPACRLNFLLLNPDIAKWQTAAEWLKTESPENNDSLDKFALVYASKFFLDDNKWVYFDDILVELGLQLDNSVAWLNSGYVEEVDSSKIFLMKINEVRSKGEATPLNLVEDQIRTILKNKKKVEFVARMEQDVYNEGIKKNRYELIRP